MSRGGDVVSGGSILPPILWIITDEQRCDSLGCYAGPWAHTPHFDRLARSGTLFTTAVAAAPMCVPARTSILHGDYPSSTGVWQNEDNPHARDDLHSLVRLFESAGYRTASFGKQHYRLAEPAFSEEVMITTSDLVGYTDYHERFDPAAYGAIRYPGPTPWILGGRFPGGQEQTSEARVVREALLWLEGQEADRPLFLRLSFNGPHTPVTPPAPFDSIVDPDSPAETEEPREGEPAWLQQLKTRYSGSHLLSPDDIRGIRRSYYGYVAFIDDLLGRFLEEPAVRARLKDAVVVYTSDHGTHLGDYGMVQKQSFYEPVVKVPFFFRCPGRVASGAVLETPVEVRWMLPALLDLLGIQGAAEPGAAALAEALRGGTEPPGVPVFSEMTLNPRILRTHERLVMVRDGPLKLTLNADGPESEEALYDLRDDPWERRNRAEDPRYREARRRLRRLIRRHLDG